MEPSSELSVVILNRQRRQRIDAARLRRVLRGAGRTLGVGGEVSLVLAGDRLLHRLNRDFRGKDRPTDVLSFPAGDDPGRLLGDVVISAPRVFAQARRFEVTPIQELRRLLVHGMLHLMGYDHVRQSERRTMRELEERLLAVAGLAIGVILRQRPLCGSCGNCSECIMRKAAGSES